MKGRRDPPSLHLLWDLYKNSCWFQHECFGYFGLVFSEGTRTVSYSEINGECPMKSENLRIWIEVDPKRQFRFEFKGELGDIVSETLLNKWHVNIKCRSVLQNTDRYQSVSNNKGALHYIYNFYVNAAVSKKQRWRKTYCTKKKLCILTKHVLDDCKDTFSLSIISPPTFFDVLPNLTKIQKN